MVESYDAVVVGAGFSGLYMLYRLRELGLSTRVLEAAGGVGGTWYWNRYPGARCDCESLYYSYSFSPELEQEWEWSERYARQPEVLRYLEHVADRFDLRRDIDLGVRVESAAFDDQSNRWTIGTDDGRLLTARFFITAVGCLSNRNQPHFPGMERFQGEQYHTGAWPHTEVDFSGKRVGVIGTGSSGIQCIPLIANQAAHLTVFQRTPNFTVPAANRPLDPAFQAGVKAEYGEWRRRCRDTETGHPYPMSEVPALAVSEERRRAVYEDLWEAGGFSFLFSGFSDLLADEAANQTAAAFVHAKIDGFVKDAEVAEMLKPTGYPFGTKRLPLDTDYYVTFNRPNVTLVDVRATPIAEIAPTGIRTSGGLYELDAIVYATGFDAMTGSLTAIDIRGREGRSLRSQWAEGPRTYLGVATPGFPNLFMITGPGSPSVLTNMPVAIEQHVEWIAGCIAYLRDHGAATIDPTEEAEAAWTEHVAEAAGATLYPRAPSWYVGANIPGKPRRFLPYAGGMRRYRTICDRVAAAGYEGFKLAG